MIDNKDLERQYCIFSNNIKFYRKIRGYTQEILAEKADLSTSYIKQIESDRAYKNLSFTTILKISKALNVDIEKLFTKDQF